MKKFMLLFSLLSSYAIIHGMDFALQKTALYHFTEQKIAVYNSFYQKNLHKTAELLTAIDQKYKPQFYKESFDDLNQWQQNNERAHDEMMHSIEFCYGCTLSMVGFGILNLSNANEGMAVACFLAVPIMAAANINRHRQTKALQLENKKFYKDVQQLLNSMNIESYTV